MPGRAKRTDGNQPAIVKALRAHGAFVQHLHMVGAGCPDLLVGYGGRTYLMEVKDEQQRSSDRRLTPAEAAWHAAWVGGPVVIVLNATDAIQALGGGES